MPRPKIVWLRKLECASGFKKKNENEANFSPDVWEVFHEFHSLSQNHIFPACILLIKQVPSELFLNFSRSNFNNNLQPLHLKYCSLACIVQYKNLNGEYKKKKIINNICYCSYIYIYIYIYIYVGSISSLMHIWLNIIDIFCQNIFFLILSICRIDFMIFGGNWLINLS